MSATPAPPAPGPVTTAGHPGAGRLSGAPGPEEELWSGNPSAKAMLGSILAATISVVVVLAVALLGYRPLLSFITGFSADAARFIRHNGDLVGWVAIAVVALLVVSRLGRLAWRLAVLKSHHYRITNQRITVESGVFSKRIEEIDMRTVEDFQLVQRFIERILAIGDITVVSSDRTTARLTLIGLPDPRQMRELIRTSAYQATRGQLFTRAT
jgi:uncharacterized membrane protein YdbT with pleckstrin-like domain